MNHTVQTKHTNVTATKGAKNYRKITEFLLLPFGMPNKSLNVTNHPEFKVK
jgi:hypothetical protein